MALPEFREDRSYEVTGMFTGEECEALLDFLNEVEDDDAHLHPHLQSAWIKLNAAVEASANFVDRP